MAGLAAAKDSRFRGKCGNALFLLNPWGPSGSQWVSEQGREPFPDMLPPLQRQKKRRPSKGLFKTLLQKKSLYRPLKGPLKCFSNCCQKPFKGRFTTLKPNPFKSLWKGFDRALISPFERPMEGLTFWKGEIKGLSKAFLPQPFQRSSKAISKDISKF